MQNSPKIIRASFLVALSALLYGFLGYLGTTAMEGHISISTMLFWRFLIAGVWMSFFVGKNYFTQEMLRVKPAVLLFVFFIDALGYAGSSGFYFIASQYIGTGLAMVIFFSYPLLIVLATWLFQRKKLNKATALTLLGMFIGLVLLRDSSDHAFSFMGLFFSLAAAAFYAFYVISSKKISAKLIMDSNMLTLVVCFGSALIFLIISLMTHSLVFPHSLKNWLWLLSLGILATALPIQLMLEGLKYLSSMKASIISALEPIVTLIMGVFILKESVSHLQIVGGILILSAALLIQFQKEL